MKQPYLAPETELQKILLELNFTASTTLPGVGIDDGSPFDNFDPQLW